MRLLKIGVTIQASAVGGDKFLAFFDRNLTLVHRTCHPRFQAAHQAFRIVLHIFQHISHRFAINRLVNGVAIGIDRNVHRIGVTEEIVHVAQNLLISTHQEDTYIILFALLKAMERNVVGLLIVVDIGGNLTITVARNVLQRSAHRGTLFESMNGHDGEELVECPVVGKRLEE